MADVTLTFTAPVAARIADALTESLELVDEDGAPRQATVADYKAYLIQKTKQFVKSSEKRVAAKAVIDPIEDIDVT